MDCVSDFGLMNLRLGLQEKTRCGDHLLQFLFCSLFIVAFDQGVVCVKAGCWFGRLSRRRMSTSTHNYSPRLSLILKMPCDAHGMLSNSICCPC
jgi:hypothetical protein